MQNFIPEQMGTATVSICRYVPYLSSLIGKHIPYGGYVKNHMLHIKYLS